MSFLDEIIKTQERDDIKSQLLDLADELRREKRTEGQTIVATFQQMVRIQENLIQSIDNLVSKQQDTEQVLANLLKQIHIAIKNMPTMEMPDVQKVSVMNHQSIP